MHLQLDVPDELIDLGVHRAIEYLTQPIVFSRVDPMGDRTAPTRLPSPNDVVYSLRLTSWVHWNHLFDVYRATVMSNDPLDPLHCRKIMIKFMGTGTFGECTEYQSSDDAVEAVYHEAKMFEKYLSKMEGTTVPAYYGLFAITVELHEDWHEDVLTMVLEDVSEPICEHYDSPYLGVETDVG